MDRTDRLVSVCMMSTEEHFASIFSFLRSVTLNIKRSAVLQSVQRKSDYAPLKLIVAAVIRH